MLLRKFASGVNDSSAFKITKSKLLKALCVWCMKKSGSLIEDHTFGICLWANRLRFASPVEDVRGQYVSPVETQPVAVWSNFAKINPR